jgi:regulatory protein YycH of two-component signal transduction system YycFG
MELSLFEARNKLKNAINPEDIFLSDIDKEYKEWAKIVHPDLYKQLQQQVYKHLKS